MKLDERFAAFKQAKAPDLWSDTIGREPRSLPTDASPRRGRKIVAAVTAFAVATGLFVVLTRSFSRQPNSQGVTSPQPITVSKTSRDGALRCTAEFPSRTIQPGATTQVRVTLTNLSSKVVDVTDTSATLLERTPSGTLLQDTRHISDGETGGFQLPSPVDPGGSLHVLVFDAPLIWPGTALTSVACPLGKRGSMLGPVALSVQTSGSAPPAADAIARALASSTAFSRCQPTQPHTPVTGVVGTQQGPASARCEASVTRYAAFDVVVLAAFCPVDARSYPISSLSRALSALDVMDRLTPPESLMWRSVVVTQDGVTAVNKSSAYEFGHSGGAGDSSMMTCGR